VTFKHSLKYHNKGSKGDSGIEGDNEIFKYLHNLLISIISCSPCPSEFSASFVVKNKKAGKTGTGLFSRQKQTYELNT